MRTSIAACSMTAVLAACQSEPVARDTTSPTSQSTGRASSEKARSSFDEATELCLAAPGGTSPVDKKLITQQEMARALPRKLDFWVYAAQGWVRKARLTSDPGFYLNADKCADVALTVEPDNHPALNVKALALQNDHRFAEARDIARRILDKDPEDHLAYGTLSDALLELGDFSGAQAAVQRMSDLRPDMASYTRAAYLRWLTGDRAGAKQLIREALAQGRDARDPEPAAWTFTQAGVMFWSEGDYSGAEAVFAEALSWVPDYPGALVGRARALMGLGKPEQAIPLLERALRVYPTPETAWLLGDAREATGDTAGAKADFDRAIREGRRTDSATLAYFYAVENRDLDEAKKLIEAELKTRGGPYIDDTHAWVLYRLGKLREARAASDRAMALGTKDARLLYHAGAIRVAQGEVQPGLALVEEALALNPKFDYTQVGEAEKLLAR